MVGHLRGQRSAGAEVRDRSGRPDADDAGEGEQGEADDDNEDRELVGEVPPVFEGIDDDRDDDEEDAPEDDDLECGPHLQARPDAGVRTVEREGPDEELLGRDAAEDHEHTGKEAAERGEDHKYGTEARLGGGGGIDDHAQGHDHGPCGGDPHRPAEVERGQGGGDDEEGDVDERDEQRVDAAERRGRHTGNHRGAQPPCRSGEGLEGEVHAAVEDAQPLLRFVCFSQMSIHVCTVPRTQMDVAPPIQISSCSAEMEMTPERPSAVP